MLPLPQNDPVWIDTSFSLNKLLPVIRNEPRLAIDTESDSLFSYKEKVCLIQISTPDKDYLIDPLAISDLSPLASIFSNPDQQKIFHASEYDIICLKRDFSFTFMNLFDTLIAARILGESQVGLGSLLSLKFGVELDKKYQRANWGFRPLSNAMLDYARMDTHYLFALRDYFEGQLKEKELWTLANEDFIAACDFEAHNGDTNGQSCWKIAGARNINEQQAAILQELCAYRDQQAQKADLPHFKVLSNKYLLELCLETPHSSQELKDKTSLSTKLVNRHGSALLRAIEAGEKAEPLKRERRPRPDEQYLKRLDGLRHWRKDLAQKLKVESDIVLPKELMERLACHHPKTIDDLKMEMEKTPWRFDRYGGDIISVLKKMEQK